MKYPVGTKVRLKQEIQRDWKDDYPTNRWIIINNELTIDENSHCYRIQNQNKSSWGNSWQNGLLSTCNAHIELDEPPKPLLLKDFLDE